MENVWVFIIDHGDVLEAPSRRQANNAIIFVASVSVLLRENCVFRSKMYFHFNS